MTTQNATTKKAGDMKAGDIFWLGELGDPVRCQVEVAIRHGKMVTFEINYIDFDQETNDRWSFPLHAELEI